MNIKNNLSSIKRIKVLTIISVLFLSLVMISGIAFAKDDSVNNNLNLQNQDLDHFNSSKYFNNFLTIPVKVLREVVRTDPAALKRNILIGGGLLFSLNYLDQDIRDYVQDNLYAGDTGLSKLLYSVGEPVNALLLYSGTLLWTKIKDDKYLENTTYYSFQSLLVTQAFTSILKNTVNRDRPRDSKDDPFSRTGGDSFISGHASGTWATMTVIAKRYPESKYLSYGFASLVSAARIYEDAHWFSDVLAGSIVGYGIGSLTLDLNDALPENIALEPVIAAEMTGAALNLSF